MSVGQQIISLSSSSLRMEHVAELLGFPGSYDHWRQTELSLLSVQFRSPGLLLGEETLTWRFFFLHPWFSICNGGWPFPPSHEEFLQSLPPLAVQLYTDAGMEGRGTHFLAWRRQASDLKRSGESIWLLEMSAVYQAVFQFYWTNWKFKQWS